MLSFVIFIWFSFQSLRFHRDATSFFLYSVSLNLIDMQFLFPVIACKIRDAFCAH